MIFGLVTAVNVEACPRQINVAFVRRAGGIVHHDAGLVFKGCDGVDVIDRRDRAKPADTAVTGSVDDDATLGALGIYYADAFERQMRMISSAVTAEGERIIALS